MLPQITFSAHNLKTIRFLANRIGVRRIPADLSLENHFVPAGPNGVQIRLRVYRAKSAPPAAPLLFWIHGGGFVIGRPELDDLRCIQFVRKAGVVVASVDYRLAPEHPYPTPLDDCAAALRWAVDHAGDLGIDPRRLALGGESAGGGLAAALAQRLADQGEIKPLLQMLVYPMLDDRTFDRSDILVQAKLTWNLESNRFGWESYLGQPPGCGDIPRYAVPARREDLSGLPPAWIGVGTLDLFHAEDTIYARRLAAAGVACEIKVIPGVVHGFDTLPGKSQAAADFLTAQVDQLKKYLS